ncbi:hypothetical protein G7B40_036890 [Aetokthonos hydrillicola Thurmond2011]|jgi:hypothetical protein|uniref:Uncharacterized protein n=1 Tax=Aetokthonos hydrillicola Thurmond2011 TaxID=2712845 RepID=A0AAP5IHZ5_9CYAN|nr:hypothetical protein [Aetokthonos hydrillicola]MBO3459654.1 hypothetical protein [Aetokthonos hydrillicola CCALA 1050]MBW4589017.1 hypothetical protein [Aetokthonos hydrillicola CCALA 1050]MDR9900090.1 hypothetical protein [Aetokthonos hydrillicola Thurmond2011]
MNFPELIYTLPEQNGQFNADRINEFAKKVEEFGLKIKRDFGEEDGCEILKTVIMALVNVI